jgi:hypothetical protein
MATFKPGISGNPSGKPKGSLNKRTQLATLIESRAEELINKTIELALVGDTVALRLCVERLIPKITDKAATVVMPDLSVIETTQIIPELLKSLAGQEINVLVFKSLIEIFTKHDEAVHKENKKHEPLKLTTKDPVEAARQYQQIMRESRA